MKAFPQAIITLQTEVCVMALWTFAFPTGRIVILFEQGLESSTRRSHHPLSCVSTAIRWEASSLSAGGSIVSPSARRRANCGAVGASCFMACCRYCSRRCTRSSWLNGLIHFKNAPQCRHCARYACGPMPITVGTSITAQRWHAIGPSLGVLVLDWGLSLESSATSAILI